jgi:predicted restriction endonuclease
MSDEPLSKPLPRFPNEDHVLLDAEGKPLGQPHNGPDVVANILCLCPNHHVLFDLGAFSVKDNLELIGLAGKFRTDSKHKISAEHLRYHREHYLNAIERSNKKRNSTLASPTTTGSISTHQSRRWRK